MKKNKDELSELGKLHLEFSARLMDLCLVKNRISYGKTLPVGVCYYKQAMPKKGKDLTSYHVIECRLFERDTKPVQIELNLHVDDECTQRKDRIPSENKQKGTVHLTLSYCFELGGSPAFPRLQARSRRYLCHSLKNTLGRAALRNAEFHGDSHLTRFIVVHDIDLGIKNCGDVIANDIVEQCRDAVRQMIDDLLAAVARYKKLADSDVDIIDSIASTFMQGNPCVTDSDLLKIAVEAYEEMTKTPYTGKQAFDSLFLALREDGAEVRKKWYGNREELLKRIHKKIGTKKPK